MEQENNHIDEKRQKIENLLKYYFGENQPRLENDFVSAIIDIINFQTNAFQPLWRKFEQIGTLIDFLEHCQGSTITMSGEIAIGDKRHMKGTHQTIKIEDESLIAEVLLTAKRLYTEAESIECSPYDYHVMKLKGNSRLGFYVTRLENAISGYNDFNTFNKTKLCSLIYDLLLLAEAMVGNTKTEIINEEGFDGDIGREKCKKVTAWLNAYNLQTEGKWLRLRSLKI